MLEWKMLNVSKMGPMKHTVPTIISTTRNINNVHIAMARHRPATGAADSRINGMVGPSISRIASAIYPKWPGITRRTILHRSWATNLNVDISIYIWYNKWYIIRDVSSVMFTSSVQYSVEAIGWRFDYLNEYIKKYIPWTLKYHVHRKSQISILNMIKGLHSGHQAVCRKRICFFNHHISSAPWYPYNYISHLSDSLSLPIIHSS